MINIDKDNDWLEQQTSGIPDKMAIISKKGTITFRELKEEVVSTTQRLIAAGIKKNDRIGILSGNNPDFVILVLALWKVNAVPVPLNIKMKPEEIIFLTDFIDCNRILIHQNILNDFPKDIFPKAVVFPFNENSIEYYSVETGKFDLQNSALTIFTSGTTSIPKAVRYTFNNLFKSAQGCDSLIDAITGDRWLASLPFYHIGGFSIIVRSLLSGCSIIFSESLSFKNISESLVNLSPNFVSFVPTTLKRFLENKIPPNKELKYLFLGGGPVESQLVKEGFELGWPIIKVYGSSETSSMVCAAAPDDLQKDFSAGGKPIGGNKIIILDNSGKELTNKKIGEVVVSGESVVEGYLNNSAETKAKFKKDKYFTGDMGYLDENNALHVTGRKDDMIITGGENVFPKEIEKVLNSFPGISESFVFGHKSKEWGEKITAVISSVKIINEESLISYLKEKLAAYKLPKKFYFVDEIPKTDMGKVNKKKLLRFLKLDET